MNPALSTALQEPQTDKNANKDPACNIGRDIQTVAAHIVHEKMHSQEQVQAKEDYKQFFRVQVGEICNCRHEVNYIRRANDLKHDSAAHPGNCTFDPFCNEPKFLSFFYKNYSGVAQLVEQVAVNHFVGGSSPSSGAAFLPDHQSHIHHMKHYIFLIVLTMNACAKNLMPPDAPQKPQELTLHGETRVDDYYWMRLTDEQKLARNPDPQTRDVLDYIDGEREYIKTGLAHTEGLQEKGFNEIVGRIKKDDSTVPYLDNGYYYYRRFESKKEYAIHCRKKGSLEAAEEIMLDENGLAEGHDYFALGNYNVSPNNQWLAYSVDTLSRRFYTVFFKNLATGEVLAKAVPNTTGSVAWANDNKTVFYTLKNKVTLLSEKIYRHMMGTDYANDELVYIEDDETFYTGVYRSKSGKYIIIWNSSTLVSDYHILSADDPDGEFRNFTPRGTEHEYSIEHFGDHFYILTNWQALNSRLMKTPDTATDMSNWKEVIPHRDDVHLLGMEIFSEHIVLNERRDGLRGLRVINLKNGRDQYIDFQEKTHAAYIGINEEFNTNVLRYSYNSMMTPESIIDYNMDTGERTLLKQREVVGGYDQDAYQDETQYATARDGQRIPVYLVYRKDLKKMVPSHCFSTAMAPTDPRKILISALSGSVSWTGVLSMPSPISGAARYLAASPMKTGKCSIRKTPFTISLTLGNTWLNRVIPIQANYSARAAAPGDC